MPRKPRVSSGQSAYILAHRIEAVARRNASGAAVDRLVAHMRRQEAQNTSYVVLTRPLYKWLGNVYVYDPTGRRYSAHHSDLIRV